METIGKSRTMWKGRGTLAMLAALLAVVALAISLSPATSASAWATNGTWDGSGTSDNPYQIADAADLTALATKVNGTDTSVADKYFKLTADIDLNNAAWTPIGTSSSNAFKGTFDGDGHKITGLNASGTSYIGLFGYVQGTSSSNRAVIKKVVVEGSVSATGSYAGGIVAYAYQYTNVEDSGSNITLTSGSYAGGVIGYAYQYCSVSRCFNKGSVTVNGSSSVYAGGIVGYTSDSSYSRCTVSSCYNLGSVSGNSSSSYSYIYLGGILGRNGQVNNCYNVGTVKTGSSGYYAYCGSISGGGSTLNSGVQCYWLDSSAAKGMASDYSSSSTFTKQTAEQMKSADFVGTLNEGAASTWKSGEACSQDTPILKWEDPGLPAISAHPESAAYQKDAPATALAIVADTPAGNSAEEYPNRQASTFTYQWFKATQADLSDGTAIGSATSTAYTPATDATGTSYYYCEVTNGEGGKSRSNAAEIGVYDTKAQAPSDALIEAGDGLTASDDGYAAAEGNSYSVKFKSATNPNTASEKGFTYSWLVSENADMSNATTLDGTSDTMTIESAALGTLYYQCKVDAWSEVPTNVSGTPADSNIIKVTVSPYTVGSVADWSAFAAKVNAGDDFAGRTVEMTADFTADAMVGSSEHPFSGVFDGKGYTLTVSIDGGNVSSAAPFAYVSGDAKMRNVTLEGTVGIAPNLTSYSSPFAYAGGLVGVFAGNSLEIDKVVNNATVTAAGSGSYGYKVYAGGILGAPSGTGTITVTKSANKASLSGYATGVGGIVGGLASSGLATIEDCYNVGSISSTYSSSSGAGGIIGYGNYDPDYNGSKYKLVRCYGVGVASGAGNNGALVGYSYSSGSGSEIAASYYTSANTNAAGGYHSSLTDGSVQVSDGDLKTLADAVSGLGSAFTKVNPPLENNGFPRLTWEPEGPAVRTLTVSVTGSDSQDISNESRIRVEVSPDTGIAAREDAHGTYTIDTDSTYTVKVSAAGYTSQSKTVEAGESDATLSFELVSSEIVASENVKLNSDPSTSLEVGAQYVFIGTTSGFSYAMGATEVGTSTGDANAESGDKGLRINAATLTNSNRGVNAAFADTATASSCIFTVVAGGSHPLLRANDGSYVVVKNEWVNTGSSSSRVDYLALTSEASEAAEFASAASPQGAVLFKGRSSQLYLTLDTSNNRFALNSSAGDTIALAYMVSDGEEGPGGQDDTHTVTFDVGSGGTLAEGMSATQKVADGGTVTKPADPTPSGNLLFDGWLLNGEAYNFDTSVTNDITLVANWVKARRLSVSFKPAPPAGTKVVFYDLTAGTSQEFESMLINENTSYISNRKETATGKVYNEGAFYVTHEYKLVISAPGYRDFEQTSPAGAATETNNFTVTNPTLTPINYDITYNLDNGANAEGNPDTYTIESDTITLADPTREGYEFLGWTADGVTEPTKALTIEKGSTGAKTFTAHWKVKTYTITWTDDADQTLKTTEVEHGTVPAYEGDNPTKEATAQYTYTFDSWDPAPVAATQNATYKAKFTTTVNKYTVKFMDGEKVVGEQQVAYNGTATAPADPTKSQFTFAGWYDGESAFSAEAKVTADVTYTAKWSKNLVSIAAIADQTFTGNQIKPEITVYGPNNEAVPADLLSDSFKFQITYGENKSVELGGTVGVKALEGSGYAGELTATFKIVRPSTSELSGEVSTAGEVMKGVEACADDDAIKSLVPGTVYVPKEAADALNAAITEATEMLERTDVSAAEVAAAKKKLDEARDAFEAAKRTATTDKKSLDTDIAEAQKAVSNLVVSADGSDVEKGKMWVTAAAKKAVDDALAAANALANSETATQKEVDDAVVALKAAIAGLDQKEGSKAGSSDDPASGGKASKSQTITTGKAKYTVKATAKKFSLGAKASGDGALTYSSANVKVAKVDANGYVKPVGYGVTTITIKAAANAGYKAAKKQVTVKVNRAKQTVKGKKKITKVLKASANGKIAKKTLAVKLGKGKTKTTYKLTVVKKYKKFFTVAKNGKVSVKRGLPAGTYKVKVKAIAKKTAKYKKATKKYVVTIKVKGSAASKVSTASVGSSALKAATVL